MTFRGLLGLSLALGIGLMLTTQGQAQDGRPGRGGFDKKFDKKFDKNSDKKQKAAKGPDRKSADSRKEGPSPRTSLDVERLQAQVKTLSARFDSVAGQLRELKGKSSKAPAMAKGPPGKGPMAKDRGKDRGQGGMTARESSRFEKDRKGPGRPGSDRKGPPSFGRDMRGGPPQFSRGPDAHRGPGPETRTRDGNRSPQPRGPERGPQRDARRRPEPSRGGLEARLDRLQQEVEALRREIRSRR
jgi:hypothetical protein